MSGGFYRAPNGQSVYHARMKHAPKHCVAPKLPDDDPSWGPLCGRMGVALCDHPVPGGTCDASMCEIHRTSVGKDLDHCPKHVEHPPEPAE